MKLSVLIILRLIAGIHFRKSEYHKFYISKKQTIFGAWQINSTIFSLNISGFGKVFCAQPLPIHFLTPVYLKRNQISQILIPLYLSH